MPEIYAEILVDKKHQWDTDGSRMKNEVSEERIRRRSYTFS